MSQAAEGALRRGRMLLESSESDGDRGASTRVQTERNVRDAAVERERERAAGSGDAGGYTADAEAAVSQSAREDDEAAVKRGRMLLQSSDSDGDRGAPTRVQAKRSVDDAALERGRALLGGSDIDNAGVRTARVPVGRPKRRRHAATDGVMCDPAEAKEYQPVTVESGLCQALLWNRGFGKLQCVHKPFGALDVCKMHVNAPHGRVRGAIPRQKLEQFKMFELHGRETKDANQWYARHMMWDYASKEAPGIDYLRELLDKDYEECLKKMNGYVKKHRSREHKKYEIGRGVRNRDDRGGKEDSKYGTERERYNGRGGGRVFKWYSQAVFNSYLKRMGASEETCTERQCMAALEATSDDLRKYDMVTDNLIPYAGPQCYPHLDKGSLEYRAKQGKLKTEAPDGDIDAQHERRAEASTVLHDGCWLTCDQCGKWRCVARDSLPVVRGFGFFEPLATDLDWEQWLAGAEERYEAIGRAQSRAEAVGVDVDGEVDTAPAAVGDGASPQQRRRRRKCADVDVVGAGPTGCELTSPARKRLLVKTRSDPAIDGVDFDRLAGEEGHVSDVSNYGERSASEHECASGAEVDAEAVGNEDVVCRPCGEADGDGIEVARSRVGRRAERERAQDVMLVRERLMQDMGGYAHAFVKGRRAVHAGSRLAGRLQVGPDDKQALLDGWLRCVQRRDERNGRVLSREAKAGIEEEKKADGSHGRLAWTLHELVRRAYRDVEDGPCSEVGMRQGGSKEKT